MGTRRDFIKTLSISAAAGIILPLSSFVTNKNKPYGLILYTVREDMKKNPIKTLESIASIGFDVLESAGYDSRKYYGMKPAEFKQKVESLGMKVISSHHAINPKKIDEIVEDASEAGIEYVVFPWMQSGNLDYYKEKAEQFNKFGEAFNKAGIRFCYHNHDFEFKETEGQIPYNVLLENTDPELVALEMDLYWISKVGFDPTEYFKKYPGRFELWHVKDMKNDDKKSFTEVGNGTIDFDKIFSKKNTSGMRYYFVEEDTCLDYSPLESIKISLDYIKKKKF